MHGVERNGPTEGQRRQDRQLVRGIDAVDVERRIGFRISELLRIGQHLGELTAALAHLRQDVVARAIQDAGDSKDAIGSKALAKRLDHRNAARNRGLERQRDAAFLGDGGEGCAVHREHSLVGGNHGLARGERRLHEGTRWTVRPADQLHNDVDGRVRGQRDRVLVPAQPGQRHTSVARTVARRHRGHRDRPASARRDDVCIVAQQFQDSATDCAQPGDCHGKRMGH